MSPVDTKNPTLSEEIKKGAPLSADDGIDGQFTLADLIDPRGANTVDVPQNRTGAGREAHKQETDPPQDGAIYFNAPRNRAANSVQTPVVNRAVDNRQAPAVNRPRSGSPAAPARQSAPQGNAVNRSAPADRRNTAPSNRQDAGRSPRSRQPQQDPLRRWLNESSRPGPWVTTTLLGFTILFALLTFLLPKREFSERENRKLADAPAISATALADGSFARGTERWFADHFVNRDFWVTLQLRFHTLLGQKENGGVWLGKDDQLFLIPQEPNETSLSRNLQAMDAFAAGHEDINTYVAVIPNACTVQSDNLPVFAPAPDQAAQLQNLAGQLPHAVFLDVTEALRARADEYLFYRTDHHWTSLGAYVAFTAMAPKMGIGTAQTRYDVYPVSSGFYGTLAAKSGRFGKPDTVEIYLPQSDILYNVTYMDSMTKDSSLFRREALEGTDHYAVFFGGNYARVDINTTAETGRHLLLFKDSYANCMMQFLYPYFDEIVMIDPRYYYENAEPLLRQHAVTDVLYLYNCDTFLNDTSLADVLATNDTAAQAGTQEVG